MTPADRCRRYVEAVLSRVLERVRSAGPGGRAQVLFAASAALGSLCRVLDLERATELLLEAALAAGLERREALGHIRRGLRAGAKQPRELPGEHTSWRPPRPAPRAAVGCERAPEYPPLDEVEALWDLARVISGSRVAATWCRHDRNLDPCAIEDYDLMRVLAHGAVLPRWARSRYGSWTESGHRLLVRFFDAQGRLRSVRVRRLASEGDVPKSLAPAGFETRGLVMACGMGQVLLAGKVLEWWAPVVVVTEGEPDFLTRASDQPERQEQGPAVFGVEAGAWTIEHAAKVPDGARVAIRTHLDEAGERYAEQIVATFKGRDVELFRLRAEETPA
jgi:hypothetical protein